jgi:hypothetical protein
MQPVNRDLVVAAAAGGSAEAWDSIVESNVDAMWQRAVAAGLSALDAAQVCELAWLRLGQRLDTLSSLAEIAGWLDVQVGREAAALARQNDGRAEGAEGGNVVRLAPGLRAAPRPVPARQRGIGGLRVDPAPAQL